MQTSTSLTAARSAVLALCVACGPGNRQPETAERPQITASDIERSGGDPIEKTLQAQSSGVLVSRTPDGGIAVQIRGPASFFGSSEPLYVVDDVPIQPGPGGALTGINPHDIESIRVLKNPEDTAIYGVRGGNGVILIQMKKPGRRPNQR